MTDAKITKEEEITILQTSLAELEAKCLKAANEISGYKNKLMYYKRMNCLYENNINILKNKIRELSNRKALLLNKEESIIKILEKIEDESQGVNKALLKAYELSSNKMPSQLHNLKKNKLKEVKRLVLDVSQYDLELKTLFESAITNN